MLLRPANAFFALAVAFCASACSEQLPPVPASPPAPPEECAAFFESVDEACRSGDPSKVVALLNFDRIVHQVVGDALSKKSKEEFRKGLIQGASRKHGLFETLATIGARGGKLKMLRTRTVKGRTQALVRMIGPDGVNYFDFDVTKDPATGELKADDIYIFLSGETISASMRRAVLPHLKGRPRGYARLLLSEDLEVKHAEDIKEILALMGQNQAKKALEKFRALPEEVRTRKHMLFTRLSIVQVLDDEEEYGKTLGMFRAQFPEDACIDMMSIDWHTLRKDYPAAIASVHRVAKSVGGDPYLLTLEGGLHAMAEDFKAARKVLTEALEAEPELDDARFSLLEVALNEEAYPEVVERIADLEKRGHTYSLAEMRKTPLFEKFLASTPGKAWAVGR